MEGRKDYYEGKRKPWEQGGIYDNGGWIQMFRKGKWASSEDIDEKMPPQYDSYHPYCCNVCKRGGLQNVSLLRCTGCKVMKYCTRKHQKHDWPNHKQWCKAFSRVAKDETEDKTMDQAEWNRRSMDTNLKLMRTMGDLRHTNDIQVSGVRPHCHRCFRSDRIPGVDLVVCPNCSGIAVCKDCLGEEDVTSAAMHKGGKEECEQYLKSTCVARV